MFKFIPILTITSLLISCIGQKDMTSTLDGAEAGIVGGQEVTADSSLSKMVVLVRGQGETTEEVGDETYTRRSLDVCTGSFISENVILTAAHCVFEAPYKLEIVYSSNINDYSAPVAQVEKVIKHPNFNGSTAIRAGRLSDDLALIKIVGKKPADYRILGLTKFPASSRNFSMTAIGYGRTTGLPATADDPLQGLGILRSTRVKVTGFDGRKNFFYVNQSSGHGVCSGDSGGPGFVKINGKHYLVGVATAAAHGDSDIPADGSDLDVCKVRSVYSNVQFYANWITQSLKDLR